MGQSNSFHLLALGDSLTEGYYMFGRQFHPYSIKLEQLVRQHYGGNFSDIQIVQAGVSGATIPHMIERLPMYLSQRKLQYKCVCILGGTNDLAPSFSKLKRLELGVGVEDSGFEVALEEEAESIFNNLCTLYNMVLEYGAKLVVITIPEAKCVDPIYVKLRHRVNAKIRNFSKMEMAPDSSSSSTSSSLSSSPSSSSPSSSSPSSSSPSSSSPSSSSPSSSSPQSRVLCLDLEASLPYPRNSEENEQFWDDNLHMSPAGYDRFGELMFATIQPIINQIVNVSAN